MVWNAQTNNYFPKVPHMLLGRNDAQVVQFPERDGQAIQFKACSSR
jgi:hypothetical protein